jgi:hypothetical protein
MTKIQRSVELIKVSTLLHIEDYSRKKVSRLKRKILEEGVWTAPLKVDIDNNLVMDGQHRMEVAKELGLSHVPCLKYHYHEVEVWSLRKDQNVDRNLIVNKALSGDIYPYKTAKHKFPDGGYKKCKYSLNQLKG